MDKLSFSLPKYDFAFNNFYNDLYDDLHLQDELLRRFPPKLMAHSGTTRWLSKPDVLEAPYRQHKNTTSGEIEIITKTDALKFKEFLQNLIIPIRDKVKEHTIENINQTCEMTGNKVDAVNQNVWDAYIEAIEKMKMVFDEDGNPNFLIHPPEFYEKLSKTDPTVDQRNKIGKIFGRKREEYILRKGSRKLTKSNRKSRQVVSELNVDVSSLKFNLSLPQYELAITQLLRDVNNGYEQLDPILSQVQKVPVAHDGFTRQVSEPTILETPMKDYLVDTSIKLDCFRNTDTEYFRDFLWKMLEEINGEVKKHIFETISQTCDATGNSVDAEGKNFWDSYNEMLETADMRFDENGNHNYKIYIHPDRRKDIEANPPSEKQLTKSKEIIERKKQTYYAQKRTRRLS